MNKTLLGLIIAVVVVVAVVLFMNNDATAPTTENSNGTQNENINDTSELVDDENSNTNPNPSPAEPQTHIVTMTDAGYTPNAIEIKKGDSVNFVNAGTKLIWPASAPHPSHTDYPAFDPKVGVAIGQTWSFTFDRVGTWRYHDHLNPTRFGSVTVVE